MTFSDVPKKSFHKDPTFQKSEKHQLSRNVYRTSVCVKMFSQVGAFFEPFPTH